MDRFSKPVGSSTSRSSSVSVSSSKKEDEMKRKSDIERERARLERESKLLFGDDSFVAHPSPIKVAGPPPSISKIPSHPIPSSSSPSTLNGGPSVKITGNSLKSSPQPISVKKSAASDGLWPLGKPAHVKEPAPMVKKAGEGQGGTKKVGVPKPVSSVVPKGPSFQPPPLPEIRYSDPSKSSALPSLADWRRGITKGFDLVGQNGHFEDSIASREIEKERMRKNRERVERLRREGREGGGGREEEEEEDWIVEGSSSEASEDEEDKRISRKKRKAEEKMDKMWEELRKITGYNPRSSKYIERDRSSIQEASHDQVHREERQTKLLGRMEDKEEEERERKAAQLKKQKRMEWKRSKGIDTSESDSDDF